MHIKTAAVFFCVHKKIKVYKNNLHLYVFIKYNYIYGGFTNIYLRKEVNGMRNEKDIKFIFSDEFDVESYNRILDLIKQLIISIQDEEKQKNR